MYGGAGWPDGVLTTSVTEANSGAPQRSVDPIHPFAECEENYEYEKSAIYVNSS